MKKEPLNGYKNLASRYSGELLKTHYEDLNVSLTLYDYLTISKYEIFL